MEYRKRVHFVLVFLLSPCLFISKMVFMQIVVVDHADVISMQVKFNAYIYIFPFLAITFDTNNRLCMYVELGASGGCVCTT